MLVTEKFEELRDDFGFYGPAMGMLDQCKALHEQAQGVSAVCLVARSQLTVRVAEWIDGRSTRLDAACICESWLIGPAACDARPRTTMDAQCDMRGIASH